jgi:hypothetical protein
MTGGCALNGALDVRFEEWVSNDHEPTIGATARPDPASYAGPQFVAHRRRWRAKYCSDRCASLNLEKFGVHIDVILRRDSWMCQLCHQPMPRDAAWPDPLSPSIDHIIPRSHGGGHEEHNLRAAHLICNGLRGNRDLSDARALSKS